jgi:hypothetical protein
LEETVKACLMGRVIFPLVIPWSYVWARFVKQPGDRWTPADRRTATTPSAFAPFSQA